MHTSFGITQRGGGEVVQQTTKIRRIEKPLDKSQDRLAQLKASGLGTLYLRHLKKFAFVQWLAILAWRNVYPIYLNIAAHLYKKKASRWRQMSKLREFVKTNGGQCAKLADATLVQTLAPKVFPAHDEGYLVSPHAHYNFPEIFVATINNGLIYGGTNLVLSEDQVICHDLYDFERDYTSEELHGRTLIDPKKSRIRWLLHDDEPEQLPVAAVFVDACASNYAHWLTEVLPRIAAFCADEQFNDIPIVVNDGLHENIMESLLLVAGPEREIVTLAVGRAIHVDVLYLTSVAGYVPFERRNHKLAGHSHGVFSPHGFSLINNQVAAFAEKMPVQAWPENIYLRRNSGVRKVTNSAELEYFLVEQGFVIVEPEKLTFLQQAQVFSHARIIVGSSGAALANILFCCLGARIFIFIGRSKDTSYWYWQNMALASGKSVNYIFGETSSGEDMGIHSDFHIKIDVVKKIIKI